MYCLFKKKINQERHKFLQILQTEKEGSVTLTDHTDGPDEYLFAHDKHTNTQCSVLVFPKAALWNWIRPSGGKERGKRAICNFDTIYRLSEP